MKLVLFSGGGRGSRLSFFSCLLWRRPTTIETNLSFSYVFLGLARMSPSCVTMPTPTLLALPSIPRQMCIGDAGIPGTGMEKKIVEADRLGVTTTRRRRKRRRKWNLALSRNHNNSFLLSKRKGDGAFSLSLSSNHQTPPTTRMEGRSRRERAPKRGAAALAALARLRGGDDDGAAADASADASAGAAAAPSRRRRQLDDFEVKDADAVYDVVDEDEYADLVAKRRREGGAMSILMGEKRRRRFEKGANEENARRSERESDGRASSRALARPSAPCDAVLRRVCGVQTVLNHPI